MSSHRAVNTSRAVHRIAHKKRGEFTGRSTSVPQGTYVIVNLMNPPKCTACGYPLTPGPVGVMWCSIYGHHSESRLS